jgi:phage-related protein
MAGEGAKLATGWLELTVSTAGAQKSITDSVVPNAEKAGKEAGGALGGGLLGSVAKFAGPLVAAVGIGEALKSGFDTLKEGEATSAQLAAGLKSTGNAANTTVGQMNDLSTSISEYSGQTKDSVGKAESLLLTFTNIKNVGPDKIFDDATTAAANMAARMGGDASSNAILLGKALNNPEKGLTALQRVGVAFTQGQKDQIKAMQDAGNTMGAQKIILGELNTEFGGSAKAAGETLPGMLNRLKTGFSELSATALSAIMPIVGPLLNALLAGLHAIAPVVEEVAGTLGKALGGVMAGLGPVFAQVGATIGPMLGQLASAIGPLIGAFFQFASAASPLSLVMKALAPVLPLLVGAFQSLVRAVSGALMQALQALTPIVTQVASILSGILLQAVQILVPIIVQLANMLGPIFGQIIQALLPIITMLATTLGQIFQVIGPLIPVVFQLIQPFLQLIPPLVQLVGALLPPIVQLLSALLKPILDLIGPLLQLLVPALTLVAQVLAVVISWIVKAITWFVALVTGNKTAGAQFMAVWQNILSFFGTVGKFFANMWTGLLNGVVNGWNQIISFFRGIPGAIVRTLSGAATWLLGIGGNIVAGMRKGIEGAWNNMVKWFEGLFGDLIGIAKKILGLASPSKVFADIGANTMLGYIKGVESQTANVQGAVTNALAPPSSTQLGAAGSSSTVGGTQITQYITTPPNEDPRVLARGIGRELVSQMAGVPS